MRAPLRSPPSYGCSSALATTQRDGRTVRLLACGEFGIGRPVHWLVVDFDDALPLDHASASRSAHPWTRSGERLARAEYDRRVAALTARAA